MPTSVRLDKESEARLARLARMSGRTKSEVIREALERLDDSTSRESASPFDRLSPFIGVARLGPGDRAARAEEILREGFGRKKS